MIRLAAEKLGIDRAVSRPFTGADEPCPHPDLPPAGYEFTDFKRASAEPAAMCLKGDEIGPVFAIWRDIERGSSARVIGKGVSGCPNGDTSREVG